MALEDIGGVGSLSQHHSRPKLVFLTGIEGKTNFPIKKFESVDGLWKFLYLALIQMQVF